MVLLNIFACFEQRRNRALIGRRGGGGGDIFICSCSARRISFEIKVVFQFISKEISRACRARTYEYYPPPPPPPTNALVTALVLNTAADDRQCLEQLRAT